MRKLTLALIFIGGAVAFSAALVGLANAQSAPVPPGPSVYGVSHMPIQPGIFGKVSAISGTTINLTSVRGSSTVYTVNAAGATVIKNGTTTALSSIAVGDMVMAQGTVSGDSVTATKIIDGFAPGMGGPGSMMRGGRYGSSTRPFNASGTRGYFGPGGGRPSGTPPFASGTFPGYGYHNFSSSTVSSTNGNGNNGGQPHPGFFGSIMNFFGGMFGHFKF